MDRRSYSLNPAPYTLQGQTTNFYAYFVVNDDQDFYLSSSSIDVKKETGYKEKTIVKHLNHWNPFSFLKYEDTEMLRLKYHNYESVWNLPKISERSISKSRFEFLELLKTTEYEFGYDSPAQKYFYTLDSKNPKMAENILKEMHKIGLDSKNYHIIKNILFILLDFSKRKREPFEYIVLASMYSDDIEIQDLCVRCFEYWNDKKNIRFLDIMFESVKDAWLKEYIQGVISDLKEV